jgi:hypothetical protein
MNRTALLCLASLLTLSAPAVAQNVTRVDPANPPAALALIRADVERVGAVTCRFTESRLFPFRKTPATLSGTSAFIPGCGLSLYYTAPSERTILLVPGGLIEVDAAVPHHRPLPAQYASMLAIYNFDLAALAQDFDLSFGGSEAAWTLQLDSRARPAVPAERRPAVQPGALRVTLHGNHGYVTRLEIVKQGSITIGIDMATPRALTNAERNGLLEMMKR